MRTIAAKNEQEKLQAVVKLEVLSCLSHPNDEAFGTLKSIGHMMHRMMNAAITACALADAGEDNENTLMMAADRAAQKQISDEKEYAAKVVEKTPASETKLKLYWERASQIEIGSSIYNFAAYKAQQAYRNYKKKAWRGEMSLPSFRKGYPICVKMGSWDIEKDEKGYRLKVKLTAGRTSWHEFVIVADGGSAHAHVQKMLDPKLRDSEQVKLADLKLVYDERKKKWYALLCYSFPKPQVKFDDKTVMAVHRGIVHFLTFAIAGPDAPGFAGILEHGGDILQFKKQISARRSSLKAHLRNVGMGARGHGRARRMATYEALGDKEARWVKTKCQMVAAAVAKKALERGCGTVIIEDYGTPSGENEANPYLERLVRQWPFFQLKSSIEWACKKNGIRFQEVPASYISQECPNCGNVDAAQMLIREHSFACLNCDFKRDLDTIAVLNMLKKSGKKAEVVKMIKKGKQAVKKLKG